ncbi:MAG: hypothetical protein J7621_25240 [Niastella sp.]|nr:hypothetical protein [Niastella sp.]
MPQSFSEETYLTIIISTLLLLFFGGLLVFYFFRQQKKRYKYEQEVSALRESFSQTILKSKLEIQELTLHQISKELHANFSHLVSLININLAAALPGSEGDIKEHILEAKGLTKQLMTDVKILSVSLNSDHIMKSGFSKALENELKRLERTGKYEVFYTRSGDTFKLEPEKEIILFRLSQEILNNIVQHAKASKITVELDYQPDRVLFTIADNGVGFDITDAREKSVEKSSTGLMNIASRASLIHADLNVESNLGEGTTVKIVIPLNVDKTVNHAY